MTTVVIGSVVPRRESELIPPTGPHLQPTYFTELARAHELRRFDAVQIGQSATSADATVLAHAVLAATDRLGVVVTLPPRVVDPVTSARALASLAALYPGRVQARIPAAHGDLSRHVEFAHLLHELWHSHVPIDHVGRHYVVRHRWSAIRPEPAPRLHVHLGENLRADQSAAGHADTCFLPASSPSDVAARVAKLKDLAGERPVRFGISVRPIVGEGDVADALARKVVRSAPTWMFGADPIVSDADRLRILSAATGAHGSAEPFVGSVDAIAARLRDYHAAGVRVFHLSGFDPLADVANLGEIAGRLQVMVPVEQQRSTLVHHVA